MMVGVPGRSKACLTCRSRRKGCDFQRPTCGQCRRSALNCGGYETASIFVNSSQQNGQKSETKFKTESYSRRHRNLAAHDTKLQDEYFFDPSQQLHFSTVSLAEPLTRHASLNQLIGTYWGLYLPDGCSFSSQAAKHSTAGWSGVVQELHQGNDVIKVALIANCLGLLGYRNNSDWMMMEGHKMYGRALGAVAKSLVGFDGTKVDEMMAAIRLLSLFELCFGIEDTNQLSLSQRWCIHAAADIAIMVSRGPRSYARGNAHRLFVDGRLHQVIIDINKRQPSVLGLSDWKTYPWSEREKDPKDLLFDILVGLPALLAELDAMKLSKEPDDKSMRRERLIKACWSYHEELQTWAVGIGKPTVDFAVNVITGDNHGNRVPSGEDLAIGHLGLLYWTTCVLLYDVLISSLNDSEIIQIPEHILPRTYCKNIAKFIQFLLAPNAGCFVTTMITFPVGVALAQLCKDGIFEQSPERMMLENVFSSEYGQAIRKFIRSSASHKSQSEDWTGLAS